MRSIGIAAAAVGAADASVPAVERASISDWFELVRAKDFDITLTPQWSWITAQSAGLSDRLRFVAVDGEAGNSYAAFLDTSIVMHGVRMHMRELPGSALMAYHGDIVCSGTAQSVLDAVATYDGRRCEIIQVPAVQRGGITDVGVREFARTRGWGVLASPSVRSPYFPIASTWDEYAASRGSKFKYNLRRKERALSRGGELTERWFTDAAGVPELLAEIARIEEASWKRTADMAITTSQKETAYYALLLPWLASLDALVANVIYVGNTAAAYSLCYRWNGRFAQMKTSFIEALADASPGLVVNAHSIQRAFESGAREFDFLGDQMPHKAQWTKQTRDHEDLFLYSPRLRSRYVYLAKLLVRRFRPAQRAETQGRGQQLRDEKAPEADE